MLLDSETVSIVNGIAAKGDPGMQGPITRFTAWKTGRYYYNGKTPAFSTDTNDDTITNNYYLDYVYYAVGDKQYWKCVKTNQVLSSEANKPGVSDCWESISSYEVLATGTLLVGKENGWVIDQGIIKHTSGNVTLNEDGSISAANGNFIVTKSGNLIAKNADISGAISANIFSSEFIDIKDCYNDKIKGYLADSATGLNIIINRPEKLNGPDGKIILNLEESTTNGATANIFIPAFIRWCREMIMQRISYQISCRILMLRLVKVSDSLKTKNVFYSGLEWSQPESAMHIWKKAKNIFC